MKRAPTGNTPQSDAIALRLLSIRQVSTYTGLAVPTLYTMVSQRRIPFVKMGRLTKFDREELDRWITRQSVRPIRSDGA